MARISPRSIRLKARSRHGRKRAVITPRPRMVGLSGRLGGNESGTAEDVLSRLCLLTRQRRFLFLHTKFFHIEKEKQHGIQKDVEHAQERLSHAGP